MPVNNFNGLNLIKLVACIMVIIVHASAINISNISSPAWGISNFLNSLSRICVPLFFMISGSLLIRNDISLFTFFKKRYSRIFPPLIFWSALYYLYPLFYGNEQARTIMSLLSSPISVHFWYLYAIIGIYLLIPILCRIYFNSTFQERILLVTVWFIGVSILPMLNSTGITTISPSLYGLNSISGYIGYIFIGKVLFDYNSKSSIPMVIGCVGFILSTYLTWLLTVNYTAMSGKFNGMFYSYLSPFVVISATCLFFIILNFKIESKLFIKILKSFSTCALGIYCLQSMMINEVAYKFNIRATHNPGELWIPAVVIVTFLLCFASCFIISKIPYLKKIV